MMKSKNWVESDGKNKKYRVAEYFRKVPVKDSLLLLSDGTVCLRSSLNGKMPPQAVSIVKERQTTRHKVEWFKLSGFQVLERGEFPGEYIPIIPVIGEEVWVGTKRILQGIVRQAKTLSGCTTTCDLLLSSVSSLPRSPRTSLPKGSSEDMRTNGSGRTLTISPSCNTAPSR